MRSFTGSEQLFGRNFVEPHPCQFENWMDKERKLRTIKEKDLEKKYEDLEVRLSQLEDVVKCHSKLIELPLSKTEQIYLRYKQQLERDSFGSFVAFDSDTEEISGIADSMDDLLKQLYKKYPRTKQFYFKHIGLKFLQTIR